MGPEDPSKTRLEHRERERSPITVKEYIYLQKKHPECPLFAGCPFYWWSVGIGCHRNDPPFPTGFMRFYLRHCLAVLKSAEAYFFLMFKQMKKRMVG